MVLHKIGKKAFIFIILAAAWAGYLLGKIPGSEPRVTLSAAHQRPPPQQPLNPSVPTTFNQRQPLLATEPKIDEAAKSMSTVTLTENGLSIHAQEHSLKNILEQIAELSAVPIIISEAVKDQVVVSHFDNVPLDEGLRKLLYKVDAFFFYTVKDANPTALQAVWVYPQGHGKRMVPMPPDAWAGTDEMHRYLRDSDPEMRARAIETLVERQGKQALEAVLEALQDEEEIVRYRALAKAVDAGVPLRGDTLQSLLQTDTSPVVRFLAFEGLAKTHNVPQQMLRDSAEWALDDAHPALREEAKNLLEELDMAGKKPSESADSTQEQLQEYNNSEQ